VYGKDVNELVTAPPHDYTGKDVSSFWQDYKLVPDLMNFMENAKNILKDHPINLTRQENGKLPANSVWLWGEGKAPAMVTLEERYGIRGALISAVDLLKGIGVYAGMEVINVPGATGYLDTNYQGKVDAAVNSLDNTDLVLIHVEAPDETGHQGDMPNKIKAIEDFDQKIVQPVFDSLSGLMDFRLVVCMDHFTPLSLKTHTTDAVPVAIYDSRHNGPTANVSYSEENSRNAELKFANGEDFFQYIISE
jgi:2,3-bisphosphoglycerate-independent phosphoglycerate mutase